VIGFFRQPHNTDSGNIYATVDGRVVSLDSIVSIYSK
jgi:hypothetical protein